MRRRALLMGGKSEPNTIIGGIGSVITTKSALATKLGIPESIIRVFEIIGNDIHCHISQPYNLGGDDYRPFLNDLTVTSYIDLDGKCSALGNSCFNGATELLEVYFPNAVNKGSGTYIFRYAEKLHTAYLPSLNSLANQCFEDNYALINLTVSSAKTITISTFNRCTSIQFLDLPNVENCNNKDSTFRNLTSCQQISAKKLKVLGNPGQVGNPQNCFTGIRMDCLIQVHVDLASDNSGNANAALQWAKDNRNATVEFYDDDGNYVSTL